MKAAFQSPLKLNRFEQFLRDRLGLGRARVAPTQAGQRKRTGFKAFWRRSPYNYRGTAHHGTMTRHDRRAAAKALWRLTR